LYSATAFVWSSKSKYPRYLWLPLNPKVTFHLLAYLPVPPNPHALWNL
jgi:hypothetical protein